MKAICDSEACNRIRNGELPSEALTIPAHYSAESIQSLSDKARDGLALLSADKELFGAFLVIGKILDDEVKQNYPNEVRIEFFDSHPVNYYINTGFQMDDFLLPERFLKANPSRQVFTTYFERIVWMVAHLHYLNFTYGLDHNTSKGSRHYFYACTYILAYVQEKELKHRKKVLYKHIINEPDALSALFSEWTAESKFLTDMKQDEFNRLQEVIRFRATLQRDIASHQNTEKEAADKTESLWRDFITVVNSFSEKEIGCLQIVRSDVSYRRKIAVLHDYMMHMKKIIGGTYAIDGREYDLTIIGDAVAERLSAAPNYCSVTEGGDEFILPATILYTYVYPRTFNYLVLSFHFFRLDKRKDNAQRFFETCYQILCSNFWGKDGFDIPRTISIEDLIARCVKEVKDYYTRHKETIKTLSYKAVQHDAAFPAVQADYALSEIVNQYSLSSIEEAMKRISADPSTIEYFNNLIRKYADPNIQEVVPSPHILMFPELDNAEEMVRARQLVVSLNVIYLLCEAIQLILQDKHSNIKIKDRALLEEHRYSLLRIDMEINVSVYQSLDSSTDSLLAFREKNGIDATLLSEREKNEEFASAESASFAGT